MDEESKRIIEELEKLEKARDLIKRNLENYKDKNNNVKKQMKSGLKDINKRILEKKNILFDKLYSKDEKTSNFGSKKVFQEKPGIRVKNLEDTDGFRKKFEHKINLFELKLLFMKNGKDRK